MLDPRIKQRIHSEEIARFMDAAFGQLDLSGSPDLTHPITEILRTPGPSWLQSC